MLDVINIRESLCYMMKYTLNKKIERDKANDINDFKDISEAAWYFILYLHKSEWDELIANI